MAWAVCYQRTKSRDIKRAFDRLVPWQELQSARAANGTTEFFQKST